MSAAADDRLPLASLLALAMAAFLTILTEALPAGFLPQMAQGLAVSESWVGQTVTIYAIGSLVAAALIVVWAARQHGFPAPVDTVLRSRPTTAAP